MTSRIQTGKPALLKKMNRHLILKLMIKNGRMGRSEIAKKTGLALPSVMRIVDSLIEDGLILDQGKGTSTGGRKPSMLELNSNAMYFIGVEIAIDTSVVLTDMLGNVIGRRQSGQMAFDSPVAMMSTIVDYVEDLVACHQIPEDKIAGVGVGTPGSNFKYLREVTRSILKGWETIDVEGWISKRLPYKVFVDNVARTRTLSELWFGSGRDLDNFLYVFVDQGVGCGIVKDGKIVRGAQDVAGEFGHTIVDYKGRPCYCGRDGCIEMYVSAGAILNDIAKRHHEHFQGMSDIPSKEAFEDVFVDAGRILGVGIGNLINLINPKAVILGGEVVKRPLVFETAKAVAKEYVFNQNAAATEIQMSLTQHHEVALGSVALVFNHIFESFED